MRAVFHYLAVMTIVWAIVLVAESCLGSPVLPLEASQALARHYPEGEIENIEEITVNNEMVYKVTIETDDTHRIIVLRGDGEIVADKPESKVPLIGGTLSLGFGVTSETSIYKGADDELRLDPALIYRNGKFKMQAYDGVNIGYDVYDDEKFTVTILGELFTDGFETSDSRYLYGMDEPDMTISVGAGALYRSGWGEVELKALTDATGEHNGQYLELGYSYPFFLWGFEFTPSLSAAYMSSEVVDYYYGVSPAESRVDRPVYSPGSALNVTLELMGVYPVTSSIFLVGILNTTWLDSSISNSPIVDSSSECSATIGVLYRF